MEYENEEAYYKEEWTKALEEYLKADEKYHNFVSLLFSEITEDGKIVENSNKPVNILVDWKTLNELKEDIEVKKEQLVKAKGKFLSLKNK